MQPVPDSLSQIVEPSHTALIVWDMQVGIGARASGVAQVRDGIRLLLDAARSSNVLVLWSKHVAPALELTSPAALRNLMRRQGVSDASRLTAFMQAGTADVEIMPGLEPWPGELIIEKSTPSFFVGTPVELRLHSRGITTVVLAGVATEQGIEMTARHALALGFFAVVAEDAVGSFSLAAHELGLTFLRSALDVVPAGEIAKAWTPRANGSGSERTSSNPRTR